MEGDKRFFQNYYKYVNYFVFTSIINVYVNKLKVNIYIFRNMFKHDSMQTCSLSLHGTLSLDKTTVWNAIAGMTD